MTKATRMLCLTHLIGNALLLWLGYYWLGVGESTMVRLVWSALLALLIIAATAWLHGSSFAFFQNERSALEPALRTALRDLPPLFVLSIAVLIIYGLLAWWRDYSTQPASSIASYLTLKFRKPVKPATVEAVFNAVLWVVRWAILPILLLPLANSLANKGWQGFRADAWTRSRQWLYWIEVVVLLLLGIWLPLKLMTWVPNFTSFGMQMTSFVIRLLIAYLLFVASWLLVAQVSCPVRSRQATMSSRVETASPGLT